MHYTVTIYTPDHGDYGSDWTTRIDQSTSKRQIMQAVREMETIEHLRVRVFRGYHTGTMIYESPRSK